eukprot:gene12697-17027_t
MIHSYLRSSKQYSHATEWSVAEKNYIGLIISFDNILAAVKNGPESKLMLFSGNTVTNFESLDYSSTNPSSHPTSNPTSLPSTFPSLFPTRLFSTNPTSQILTLSPSIFILSNQPTSQPTSYPTLQPSSYPTQKPSNSKYKTIVPSSFPSAQPSLKPSLNPTNNPTFEPSNQPFDLPTTFPSKQPMNAPTSCPTVQPTSQPTPEIVQIGKKWWYLVTSKVDATCYIRDSFDHNALDSAMNFAFDFALKDNLHYSETNDNNNEVFITVKRIISSKIISNEYMKRNKDMNGINNVDTVVIHYMVQVWSSTREINDQTCAFQASK